VLPSSLFISTVRPSVRPFGIRLHTTALTFDYIRWDARARFNRPLEGDKA